MEKNFKKLCPFKGWVLENFPFIEADFDAITNYELICKITEYLNNVIKNQNEVQDLASELLDAYNYLMEHLEDYFNIELQEKVDVKLNEMAEDGTLDEIISKYISDHIINIIDTLDDLKDSSYAKGQTVKTLGYHSINDGGAGSYYITDTQPSKYYETLDSGLYAELLDIELNIKQFGAYGDGTHDDTQALKNAINYLKSLGTVSQCLNINAGKYLISESITLPLYIKLVSLGNVEFDYTGTNEFIHLVNTETIYEDLSQNAYNLGNIIDGSNGVIIIKGTGTNGSQTGIKIGEDTLGTTHVTHSAWFNITNVYIEKFGIGIYFTNIQNYMQRFYNVIISNCGKGISNSISAPVNSGEVINWNSCSILNNNEAVEINNIINFNFNNCNIDYNKQGFTLNLGGYYELNLNNCWLESNNDVLGTNYLIKSNATQTSLTTVNVSNCWIFPKSRIPSTQFTGKMYLNLNNNTLQANRYTQGNYAIGEFLVDSSVTLNSFNGLNFTDNAMLSSSNKHINENWNMNDGTVGDTSINGFVFVAGAGSSTVTVSDARYYTANKSLQVASNGTYKTIKTTKFDVSKYNKIIGDMLIYLPNLNGGSNGLNITTNVKFYDADDTEITSASLQYNQNFTYTVDKLDQWFSIPQGINKSNMPIDVPFNAKTCEVSFAMGNIRTNFYIDNITITGY